MKTKATELLERIRSMGVGGEILVSRVLNNCNSNIVIV